MPRHQNELGRYSGQGYVLPGEAIPIKPHGFGKLTANDGRDIYEGDWQHGLKHGKGTYIYADGTKYIGEYRNDQVHGSGTLFYTNGLEQSGYWSYGEQVVWVEDNLART